MVQRELADMEIDGPCCLVNSRATVAPLPLRPVSRYSSGCGGFAPPGMTLPGIGWPKY
ncbi:hypothetical protein [Inquilinus sp. CA228]|uniref:hypothetical protein n=1 Tax=Inquilinus sp. CA228 TaxID=3455609 RepID=UPI003F8D4FBD